MNACTDWCVNIVRAIVYNSQHLKDVHDSYKCVWQCVVKYS